MSISKRQRFRIFIRDGFRCQYCGRSAPAVQLHVDHRHPSSAGGGDDDANLVTSCFDCNSGKSDVLLPVSLQYQGGPLAGQTFRTTEPAPLIWVWRTTDDGLVVLEDALVENVRGQGRHRKARRGPSWLEYPPEIVLAARPILGFRPDTGSAGILLGAYLASDRYPFVEYAFVDWAEPWQLLLDFDFNDPREP